MQFTRAWHQKSLSATHVAERQEINSLSRQVLL